MTFTPQFTWSVSPVTGGLEYRYVVTLTDDRPDLSHFGISIECPTLDNEAMMSALLADLHFTPGVGQGWLKWNDLPSGNAPGVWEFWFVSDRLPTEGIAVAKGGPDSVTFVTEVPGCNVIPEPASVMLVVAGLVALIFRRKR